MIHALLRIVTSCLFEMIVAFAIGTQALMPGATPVLDKYLLNGYPKGRGISHLSKWLALEEMTLRAVLRILVLIVASKCFACGNDSKKASVIAGDMDSGVSGTTEVCDGVDNDGDGMIDEMPDATKATWTPITSGTAIMPRFFVFKSKTAIYGVDENVGQLIKWDGEKWNAVTQSTGLGGSGKIAPFFVVSSDNLFYGLREENTGQYKNLVKWTPDTWSAIPKFDTGTLSAPYFDLRGQNFVFGIGNDKGVYKFNGTSWSAISSGAVIDDFFHAENPAAPEIYAVKFTAPSTYENLYKYVSNTGWVLFREFAGKPFFEFVSADEIYMIGRSDEAVYRVSAAASVAITAGLSGMRTFHRVCDAEVYAIDTMGNVCWFHE